MVANAGGVAGTITTSSGSGGSAVGGLINTSGGSQNSAIGGYLNTSGNYAAGGYLNTRGSGTSQTGAGGHIDTAGVLSAVGGNIETYAGGGAGSGTAGGNIKTFGGTNGGGGAGAGGSIETYGSSTGSGVGGSIKTYGNSSYAGGNIYTYASASFAGGSIDLHAGSNSAGGSIDLSGSNSGSGTAGSILMNNTGTNANAGSINTRAGNTAGGTGGSIDTHGSTSYAGGSINTYAGFAIGGSINTYGNSGAGGNIDTHGGSNATAQGGYIYTSGGTSPSGAGGNIDTRGGTSGAGGAINTSANAANNGGSINTSGGAGAAGGSINTSNGGGSISTTGTGSIQFGVAATRTTLAGNGTGSGTVNLPDPVNGSLTLATLTGSESLTNKTINGNTFTAGSGTLTLSTFTLAVTGAASISGTHTGNSSNTNTGDQTSIVGISGTIAEFNTACSNADFATIAGAESLTNKKLGSLTTNGLVTTSGDDGTLSVTTVVPAANGGTGVSTSGTTSQIAVGGGTGSPIVWTTATGSGAPVRATGANLVTPWLGVATCTSINNVTLNGDGGSGIDFGSGGTITLSGVGLNLSGDFYTEDAVEFYGANYLSMTTTGDTYATFPVGIYTLLASTDATTGSGSLVRATSPTLTTPVIAGLTASGSTSINFSGNSGTFKSSTGANTLGGAVTINDATTPSLTTASGKTNTGFVMVQGKTSGSLKLITVDAAAQAVTVSLAAQTSSSSTLTIPDQLGVSRNFVFDTATQTLSNKTLSGTITITSPVLQLGTSSNVNSGGLWYSMNGFFTGYLSGGSMGFPSLMHVANGSSAITASGVWSYSGSLGTNVLPAGAMNTQYKVMRITEKGYFTTTGTPTFSCNVTVGGQQVTGILSAVNLPTGAGTGSSWEMEVDITTITTGSSGTMQAAGTFWLTSAAGTIVAYPMSRTSASSSINLSGSTNTVAVNFTLSGTVSLTLMSHTIQILCAGA
jgi:hypothetical protein